MEYHRSLVLVWPFRNVKIEKTVMWVRPSIIGSKLLWRNQTPILFPLFFSLVRRHSKEIVKLIQEAAVEHSTTWSWIDIFWKILLSSRMKLIIFMFVFFTFISQLGSFISTPRFIFSIELFLLYMTKSIDYQRCSSE